MENSQNFYDAFFAYDCAIETYDLKSHSFSKFC